jgi:hypothetical protein
VRRGWTLALFVLVAACREPPPMLPVVPTPVAQLPSLDDLVRTCAFEVSCLKNPPAATLSACYYYFQAGIDWAVGGGFFAPRLPSSEWRRYVDCAVAATSCKQVLTCVSRGHDPTFCAAHPGLVCDGDVLVNCATADWALYTTDCAAEGMHCEEANGSASCTDGIGCTPGPAYCEGNRYYVTCDATTLRRSRIDCARSDIPNATCRIDPRIIDQAGCLPSGPPCAAGNRCEGDELVTCVAGEEARIDCTQRAGHCAQASPIDQPQCVADVDCGKTTQECSGDGITVCVDGITDTIDCSAIGLTTCVLNPDGSAPICIR